LLVQHEGHVTASRDSSAVSSVVSSSVLLYVGLSIMIVSEAATLMRIEPFWSWNTPIAWTGFIIFADAMVWRARGNSWIRSAPREFAALALVSIPLWLVFEGYNRIIVNWNYVGLPENTALRYFGYAWSFATIWPAVFEGAELIAVVRARRVGKVDWARRENAESTSPPASPALPALSALAIAAVGVFMLAYPFFVSPAIARYLAAPIWLGFIFFLDPINARLGGASLLDDWRRGRSDRLVNLGLSGFLCGGLWEFWNYWSRAKWHYTVPIMADVKIFEMPLPGYFGFPAFALECFTMYVFVRVLYVRLTASARAPAVPRGVPRGRKPDTTTPNSGRTIAL
jgi:hypothetical protein